MLKKLIRRNFINVAGWRTKRKIIVIESDDWGSIRMPSKETYKKLLAFGIRVDLCPYNKYDSLASKEDLEDIFNVFDSFKDIKGNSPIITANTNVTNPDFDKISESDFSEYHYQFFTQNLKEQFSNDVFSSWQLGIENKLFYPQLHGREHVNPIIWMDLLKGNHPEIIEAFNHKTFGLSRITSPNIKKMHLAALIYKTRNQRAIIEKAIFDGATIFNDIFGYTSKSFIAPVYTWAPILEKTLKAAGIEYIQGGNSHKNTDIDTNKTVRVKRHFLGEKNNLGQIYLFRNCVFEPSLSKNFRLENTLKEIDIAFRWKKPAIICSHRLNYISSLDADNKNRNIKHLLYLLKTIQRKWPNVEFMSSTELGDIIRNGRNEL